jgi:tetratricopeptide (TPR) repeat protein
VLGKWRHPSLVVLVLGILLGVRLLLPTALEYEAERALLTGRLERALRLYDFLGRWYPDRATAGLYELQEADIYYYKYGDLKSAESHYWAALKTGKLPDGLESYAREQLTLIALYGRDKVFFPRYIAVADAFRRGSSAGYEEAEALGEALIADEPPPELAGETWFLVGESRLRLKKYEEAVQAYEAVFSRTSKHRLEADALYGAAYSAEQAGDYVKACRYYERLAQDYPGTLLGEVGLYTSAVLAEKLGDPDGAHRRLVSYLNRYPKGYFAAEAADELKKLVEKRRTCRTVIRRS